VHCSPTTLSLIFSHNMSSGELFLSLLISVQAQCHHTSCSSNSTSPLSWALWSPSRCSALQKDGNRPATNPPISSHSVPSDPAHFSLFKLSVAVCEVAIMKGCTEVLFGEICRGERRFYLLKARPTGVTVFPYRFRICCITFLIDVINICRWRLSLSSHVYIQNHVGSFLCKDSVIWYSVIRTKYRHNKLWLLIIQKTYAHFLLHIILIISFTIISHNWHN
jgi:hypothetical protein